MKTPRFWYRNTDEPAPVAEKLLGPLSCLYSWGYKSHQNTQTPQRAPVPVLCLGNLNAGGSGKTPAVIALMDIIRNHQFFKNPFFLTRGYGGRESGPLRVDTHHTPKQVGDEALLLTRHGPTVVSRDRIEGANKAALRGADVIIMDDGLQNNSIMKDIKFVVINGAMGFGNQKTLPAGPLRQPLGEGLENADVFILIGEDERQISATLPKRPLIKAHLEVTEAPSKDQEYLAFAGLGYPDKFFSFLKAQGYNIRETVRFSDHHVFKKKEIENLKSTGLKLITTEKDAVRLPKDTTDINVLKIKLVFEDENQLAALLKTRLSLS